MPRRALVRRSVAAVAAATLVSGAGPLIPTAFAAEGSGVVFPAAVSAQPRSVIPLSAGPNGYLRYEEGKGHFWSTYAGESIPVHNDAEGPEGGATYGAGSNVIAALTFDRGNIEGTVRLFDPVAGTNHYIDVPSGHRYVGTYGATVVTYSSASSTTPPEWHTHRIVEGTVQSAQLTGWPEGATRPYRAVTADADGMVSQVRKDSALLPVWIADRVRPVARVTAAESAGLALTPQHVVEWTKDGKLAFYTKAGTTPEGALPADRVVDLAYQEGDALLGIAGDHVFVGRQTGSGGSAPYRVVGVPLAGGTETTVLAYGRANAMPTPDGTGLLVVGGDTADALGMQLVRFTDGAPTVRKLTDVTRLTSLPRRLSFSHGRLESLERMPDLKNAFRSRTVSVTGPLTAGATVERGPLGLDLGTCTDSSGCPDIHATGDGRTIITSEAGSGDQQSVLVVQPGATQGTPITGYRSFHVLNASGRHASAQVTREDWSSAVVTIDLDTGRELATIPASDPWNTALQGDTVWTAGATAGTVTAFDARTGAAKRTVNLGSGCRAESLKVTAHWLSWDCASATPKGGVYDLDKGVNRSYTAPVSELGDGYVVWRNGADIKVTDVRGTTPVEIATHHMADDGESDYRHAVDTAAGLIAFPDNPEGDVRVVGAGVPASPLARIDADVPAAQAVQGGAAPWKARWWLSKPAASWQLTIKDPASGAVLRTLSGGEARGLISAAWDGKDAAGALVLDGTYAWSLTAAPADGQGAALVQSGTVAVSGASASRRDHNRDGFGDLMSLSSSGALAYRYGSGTGTLSGAVTGSGWPTTVVAVPFGDLNRDGCNDLLVRMASGELRAYKPGCGKAATPSTPYTSLGTVWGQFNVLTSPGDMTGDGRPDLVARQATTGDIYLYADNGAGGLKARGRIATNWKAYRAIVGAGDLNRDGVGDLLAVDGANSLWRYDGTATGTVKPRALVFGNSWASGRNAFVGAGDITGDGIPDLLTRNTAGDLLRNNGSGTGTFRSTIKIATGWQGYKALF
ncbi:FG-GAP-like repeat-containing protein [Streptomyces coeruleoprunus]|uniref:FG-GAP-like repeat-containing protein n=1 Tax=Streptomyces coeruleoprunus TaxID=285563 RepID=A0ABV9XCT0_9ACTN